MPYGVVTDKLDGKQLVYDVHVSKGPQLQRVTLIGVDWDHANHQKLATYKHDIGLIIKMRGSLGSPWSLCAVKELIHPVDIKNIKTRTVYERVDGFKTRRAAIEHRLYQMGIYERD